MRKRGDRKLYASDWACINVSLAMLALCAALLLWFFSGKAEASDWRVGVLAASAHMHSTTYTCNGIETKWNENNPGFYVGYKNLVIGRYENSISGCNDYKYSNLLAFEESVGKVGPLEASFTLGVADGYDTANGYRPWASINGKVGPLKLYYAFEVAAFALEYQF